MKENPHTLLSRFYGLHRVKLPRGRKIHFVIMNNIFPPHRDIHEIYDLKVFSDSVWCMMYDVWAQWFKLLTWSNRCCGALQGSTIGREYPEEEAKKNPRAVLKDLNWLNRKRNLELGPVKQELFVKQLKKDVEVCTFSIQEILTHLLGTRLLGRANYADDSSVKCGQLFTHNRWFYTKL